MSFVNATLMTSTSEAESPRPNKCILRSTASGYSIRWTYCSTEYIAGRISGGYGITTSEGGVIYTSYSADDVLAYARRELGYGR